MAVNVKDMVDLRLLAGVRRIGSRNGHLSISKGMRPHPQAGEFLRHVSGG